jgi:hypothetical protein
MLVKKTTFFLWCRRAAALVRLGLSKEESPHPLEGSLEGHICNTGAVNNFQKSVY